MKNTAQAYRNFTVHDFDEFNCLKISRWFYLLLVFIGRAYAVWLISVTNLSDKTAIISWVYPDKGLFYLNLVTGLPALFFALILILRRPDASVWVVTAWRNIRVLVVLALLLDMAIALWAFAYWLDMSTFWLAVQITVEGGLIVYCYNHLRFQLNLREFPEKLS